MDTKDDQIRVILVGGSGYTGFEAVRYLARHPQAELIGVYGPEHELGEMEGFHPLLSKQVGLCQELFEADKLAGLGADLAILCVPHQVAMNYVPALRQAGLRVIDLSADYRLCDAAVYEQWYAPHTDPAGLAEAVYGLPELNREQIREARLIACPGFYPNTLWSKRYTIQGFLITRGAPSISGKRREPAESSASRRARST